MADFSKEVEAIASISSAVVLNMGIINDDMVEAMIIAGKKANECGIPVIYDPVGAGVAQKLNCTVAITGVEDVVSDSERSVILSNGSKMLASVTGTGCMTSALCGAYAGSGNDYFIAAVGAVLSMSISGEISEEKNKNIGLGSFHVGIMDAISNLTAEIIKDRGKITFL